MRGNTSHFHIPHLQIANQFYFISYLIKISQIIKTSDLKSLFTQSSFHLFFDFCKLSSAKVNMRFKYNDHALV